MLFRSELATLYGLGAEKYAPRNWERGYDYSLSYAALQRHANLWWDGEDLDEEIGVSHLASVAWHALALMTFLDTHPELDDRPATLAARREALEEDALAMDAWNEAVTEGLETIGVFLATSEAKGWVSEPGVDDTEPIPYTLVRPGNTRAQVIATHRRFPHWPSETVADLAGCSSGYARKIIRDYKNGR